MRSPTAIPGASKSTSKTTDYDFAASLLLIEIFKSSEADPFGTTSQELETLKEQPEGSSGVAPFLAESLREDEGKAPAPHKSMYSIPSESPELTLQILFL